MKFDTNPINAGDVTIVFNAKTHYISSDELDTSKYSTHGDQNAVYMAQILDKCRFLGWDDLSVVHIWESDGCGNWQPATSMMNVKQHEAFSLKNQTNMSVGKVLELMSILKWNTTDVCMGYTWDCDEQKISPIRFEGSVMWPIETVWTASSGYKTRFTSDTNEVMRDVCAYLDITSLTHVELHYCRKARGLL